MLVKGDVPSGMCVCHHCDNPKCVNPSHLFIGTQKDNMIDCREKGRLNRPTGERHGNSHLKDWQVKEIKTKYNTGEFFQSELGIEYGISQTHVSRIIRGESRDRLTN